ncbi:MAG: outer membrane beta-barrel protein [Crocinitomicaceae bacterium]|nr:outer membrane beta-barrel protein [Crocinitomicaceae bacterium]
MKNLNLAILILVLGVSTSFGQHFDIRAYGGMNILQLTSDEGSSLIDGVLHDQTVSGRPGYQFGAAVTFGSRFYVQPGFQMTKLSTKIVNKNTITGTDFTDKTTLNVISVPLKVGFRLINPDAENLINVRVFGGIDGHHVTKVNHSTTSGNLDEITSDDYTNLILSGDFGLGLDIFIFYIEAGYQLGLTPIHRSGNNAKSNAFYGNAGVRIGF